ncbi:MAG: hypothetical protein ACFCVH_04975 [Alphaproteobacteria bacterium]
MTVLADIALVVALFVTLMLHPMKRSNDRLAGPDRAGSAIAYFLVTPFRWLALAVALGVAIGDGGFAWLGDSAAGQAIIVYLVLIAAGVASVILLVTGSERSAPPAIKIACAITAYGVPLAIAAYVAWAVNPALQAGADAGTMRAILLGTLALGLVTTLAAAAGGIRATARRARLNQAAIAAAAEASTSDRMAELSALGAQAPLWQLLDFTGGNEPEAVQERALAMVAARPTLHEDLAALLAGNWVIEALSYVRWHFQASPATLALPVRDALLRVVEVLKRRIDGQETPFPGQFELEVGQAVDLAERYHGPYADFRPALIATRDALDLVTGRLAAPKGRARLDAWLKRH